MFQILNLRHDTAGGQTCYLCHSEWIFSTKTVTLKITPTEKPANQITVSTFVLVSAKLIVFK